MNHLRICLLGFIVLLGCQSLHAQKPPMRAGLYFRGGMGSYRTPIEWDAAVDLGGAASYPVSEKWAANFGLGYSRHGIIQTRIATPYDYESVKSKINQARLDLGLGSIHHKHINWTMGGYVAVLIDAKEKRSFSKLGAIVHTTTPMPDQFRKYDWGLQVAMHAKFTEQLYFDMQVRYGLRNIRPGWSTVSTRCKALVMGLSWFPNFRARKP